MARPNKLGLQYYNIDTDRYSDIRIRRLKNAFGCVGIAVYDYILNSIYYNGCVLQWGENTMLDVAEYFDLKETTILEIINYCCATGLYDKELFTSESILTSKSIQERYVLICKNAKIKYNICNRYNLISSEYLSKSTEDFIKSTEEMTKSSVKSTQIKKNKNKKKNISSEILENPTPVHVCYDDLILKFKEEYLNGKIFENLQINLKINSFDAKKMLDEFVDELKTSRKHSDKVLNYNYFYSELAGYFFNWAKQKINFTQKENPKTETQKRLERINGGTYG